MVFLCPCGNEPLIKGVTGKGKNERNNRIPNCLLYSFEDELRQCPCGRGFCRNDFRGPHKFWCCCILGNPCGFREKIVQTWQPPSYLSQSPSARSQSSPSLEVSGSGEASSNYTPTSSNSQVSPSRRTSGLLLKALQVTRENEAYYLDIIKDLANVSLDD
ncbi:hypothetical protein RND81_07G163300 [Saponaria officinalis]|uniref:Uncharacterized protein n=1 Tax=Saponaria officinalis TaxID=3572 RepID=A0AAW1JRY1_SAPOF